MVGMTSKSAVFKSSGGRGVFSIGKHLAAIGGKFITVAICAG